LDTVNLGAKPNDCGDHHNDDECTKQQAIKQGSAGAHVQIELESPRPFARIVPTGRLMLGPGRRRPGKRRFRSRGHVEAFIGADETRLRAFGFDST